MRANNVPKREYQSNRHGVSSCKDPIVWCPRYRRKVLVEGVDKRLKEIIQQTAAEFEARIIELEVMPDHVHLLGEGDPQFGVHRLVGSMKGRSLRLLRQAYSWLRSRLPTLWRHSYFVATVGGAPLTMIKQSIENQKNV
jgi:putative transposase